MLRNQNLPENGILRTIPGHWQKTPQLMLLKRKGKGIFIYTILINLTSC
jgi:hypothetical protein